MNTLSAKHMPVRVYLPLGKGDPLWRSDLKSRGALVGLPVTQRYGDRAPQGAKGKVDERALAALVRSGVRRLPGERKIASAVAEGCLHRVGAHVRKPNRVRQHGCCCDPFHVSGVGGGI
jgi:hypothetical protein